MSGNVDGIRKIAGGVTAAKGFKAASTAAGIKYRDRKDMACLLYTSSAGMRILTGTPRFLMQRNSWRGMKGFCTGN